MRPRGPQHWDEEEMRFREQREGEGKHLLMGTGFGKVTRLEVQSFLEGGLAWLELRSGEEGVMEKKWRWAAFGVGQLSPSSGRGLLNRGEMRLWEEEALFKRF